ncbi:MAG: hypothetical protein RI924_1506 [Bacteroidota bacterium]
MPLLKFNKVQKRRISVFFVSFCIACGLWIFYALAKPQVFSSQMTFKWVDIPADLQKNIQVIDTLSVQVKGSGWNQFLDDLSISEFAEISLKELKGRNYLVLRPIIDSLNKTRGPKEQLVSIKPDTLFFDRARFISKKVPVKLKSRFQFEKFYGLAGPVSIRPAFVTLTGEPRDVENVDFIETQLVEKSQLNNSFEAMIALNLSQQATYTSSTEKVQIQVPVGQYTEKVLEIEPQIRNLSGNSSVTIYPTRVKLTLSTSLPNYAKIKGNQIVAYIDFKEAILKNYSRIPIKFEAMPTFIKIVKVEPQTVDFIIYP